MRTPALDWLAAYGSILVELGGAGVGFRFWRRLPQGPRRIVLWLAASGVADISALIAGRRWHNAQPVARVWFLVCVVLALGALASVQHSAPRAAALRVLAGVYALTWLVLVATVEPIQLYSSYSAPLHGVVLLLAASATVFRRISLGRRDLLVDPGFLIGIGLIAYAVPASLQTLVAQLSVNSAPQLGVVFYAMSSVVSVLAELIFIRAIMVARRAVVGAH